MPYKFERDELLQLLIRAYDEGNCGFLDLSESVAEKLIEENESKYEEEKPFPDPIMAEHAISMINFSDPIVAAYPTGSVTSFTTNTVSIGDSFATRNFGRDPVQITTIQIDVPDNLVAVNSNHEESVDKQLD